MNHPLTEDNASQKDPALLAGRTVTLSKLPCGKMASSAPPDENGVELLADFPMHRGVHSLDLWGGRYLGYARNNHAGVVCDLKTGRVQVITGPIYRSQFTAWVRGSGTTVVYDERILNRDGPDELAGAPWALYTFDLVTGERKRIAHGAMESGYGLFRPSIDSRFVMWSQDGGPVAHHDPSVKRNQLMSYELATGITRILDPDIDPRSVLSLTEGMVYFNDQQPPDSGPLLMYRVPVDGSAASQVVPGYSNVEGLQVRDGLATWISIGPDTVRKLHEVAPYIDPLMAVKLPESKPVMLGYASTTQSSGRFVAWVGSLTKEPYGDYLWISDPADPTHPIRMEPNFNRGETERWDVDGDLLAWGYVADPHQKRNDRHVRISRIPLPRSKGQQ